MAFHPSPQAPHPSDYLPHILTLSVLLYLLGPTPASITLILSTTAIVIALLLRSSSTPSPAVDAAVAAASTVRMHSIEEVRAFYYGYMKGYWDGRRGCEGMGGTVHVHGHHGPHRHHSEEDEETMAGGSESGFSAKMRGGGICGPVAGKHAGSR
jgi:hypothetical protein